VGRSEKKTKRPLPPHLFALELCKREREILNQTGSFLNVEIIFYISPQSCINGRFLRSVC
jgi:hypothetical protein